MTPLAEANLSVTARLSQRADHLLVTGVVEDAGGGADRAVDVVFRLPFKPALWWPRISEVAAPGAGTNTTTRTAESDLPPGAAVLEATEESGLTQDVLPIGCVTDAKQRAGVAIAVPPDSPCRFRFAYVADAGCLELTLLFGLSAAAPAELKSRAPFRFVIMPVDGRWGLRDAVRRYYAMFPRTFERKTRSSGLWLFAVPSFKQVPDPENYAFWEGPRLKELDQALAHKIENYPYIIVGQREITHLKNKLSGYDDVLAALKQEPARDTPPRQTKEWGGNWADVKSFVESCGLHDAQGRWVHQLRSTEWGGNSITFPLNPSPLLPGRTVSSTVLSEVEATLKDYPRLAGIYVDSLASWGSFYNHRREHFAAVRAPLSQDDAGRVCIPNWMPHVDFLRELRRRIGGRLVFGNGIRPGRAFCAFECDILGVETAVGDLRHRRNLDFYRTVGGAKPFLFLFYSPKDIPRATAEEYVQRFIAMGLSPEVKGEPWGRNKKRDADLLAKFLPIYRRLDLASWQPVTHAMVEPRTLWLERFGTKPPDLYFTLYNPTDEPLNARLTLDHRALALTAKAEMKELVTGGEALAVPPKSLRVVQLD
ncbi:MAG: hypothetical protein HZC54_03585 [Verrucomicrobia bacterium]|nr:hypothetical protein [Verrucomicrobiota bacterium]